MTDVSPPSISLIVTVYNQAHDLPGLFSSLDAQHGDVSYEVIICDDGSKDGTHVFLMSDPLVARCDLKYIWQPDQGFRVGRSRNNGLRCARGDVLVLIDGNCILEPFFLQDHWAAHRGEPRLVYGGRRRLKVSNGDAPGRDGTRAEGDLVPGPSDLEHHRQWLPTQYPWMACIAANLSLPRTHAILFDEAFEGWGSEDRDFAYRLWKGGLAMHVLDRTGLVQIVRGGGEGWNPLTGGSGAVVASLKGKLHLYRKHSADAMAPSLDHVRRCHLDRRTNTWRLGHPRQDVDIPAILEEFERWLETSSEPRA